MEQIYHTIYRQKMWTEIFRPHFLGRYIKNSAKLSSTFFQNVDEMWTQRGLQPYGL